MASTALDIISGALLNINATAPGQPIPSINANAALNVLNDLLDSLSNDEAFVYTQQETIFNWIAGQFQYTVGNPQGGTFVGTVTANSPLITGITSLPSQLVASLVAGAGSTITDLQGVIPVGTNLFPVATTVLSIVTGATTAITFTAPPTGTSGTLSGWVGGTVVGLITFSDSETRVANITSGGNVTWAVALTGTPTASGNSVNTTSVTMSQNATATPSINPDVFTYTVPGNIPMNRPLRFREGFTRSNSNQANLDYTFKFTDFDNYKRELLKNVQGPWPYIAAYQPTFPYGQLYVYPAPGSNYTAHIFSDLILSEFANTTSFYSLPQGYSRALKKLLALELAPNYGKTPSPQLILQAKEAKELLRGTNSTPVAVLQFDSSLNRSQVNDASWVINGGFT